MSPNCFLLLNLPVWSLSYNQCALLLWQAFMDHFAVGPPSAQDFFTFLREKSNYLWELQLTTIWILNTIYVNNAHEDATHWVYICIQIRLYIHRIFAVSWEMLWMNSGHRWWWNILTLATIGWIPGDTPTRTRRRTRRRFRFALKARNVASFQKTHHSKSKNHSLL